MSDIFENATWWRAYTLSERGSGPPEPGADCREYGERRLRAWQSGRMVSGGTATLDRWHSRGIGEEQLVALLGETAESLASRLPRPPWLATVEEAWRNYAESDVDIDPAESVSHSRPFAAMVEPLLRWGTSELSARLERITRERGAPTLPGTHPLLAPPVDEVSGMISGAVVLAMNVERMRGELHGSSPEERFSSFVGKLRDPWYSLSLLAQYPVLVRELVAAISRWIDVRCEFAERYLQDLPLLRERFGTDWPGLADVESATFGVGDSHRGGRSVGVLSFTDGQRLVYKPRSLAGEDRFAALLDWVNACGLTHGLWHPRTVDREEYGWSEYVSNTPCHDPAEVERFFHRQGAMLAVLYALCGTDVHYENVIAVGEYPVVVDLEMVLHGPVRVEGADGSTQASRVVQESVLGVGMLPALMVDIDEHGIYVADSSGLAGGGEGNVGPIPAPGYADVRTDVMRVVRERRPIPAQGNVTLLQDRRVDANEYRQALLAGFEECYRLLASRKRDLRADDGPIAQFRDVATRAVIRPTMVYGATLGESWHPDVLRDALDREYLFEVLAEYTPQLPGRERLIESELRHLSNADIPYFTTAPTSTALWDGQQLVTEEFLERPGLDRALDRIDRMSPDDLRKQQWCIEAALSALSIGIPHAAPEPEPLPAEGLSRELAVEAATRMGDVLLAEVLGDLDPDSSDRLSWLSLDLVGEKYWTVGLAQSDLYSGVSGIALFLAHLHVAAGDPRYREIAERIVEHIAGDLERELDQLTSPGEGEAPGLLGAYGYGGMISVLAQAAQLWDRPALLERALQMVPIISRTLANDQVLDVIGGAAGSALVLAELYRLAPSDEIRDALSEAGRVLEERGVEASGGVAWPSKFEADRFLLGFAHGTSGVACALARIAEITGAHQYYRLAGRAIQFERAHLTPSGDNWLDLRQDAEPGVYMNAWCHGAAGIGLARAYLLSVPGMSEYHSLLRSDLEIAVNATRRVLSDGDRYLGVGNDSLCHGDLGLIEMHLTAAPVIGDPELADLALRCARSTATRMLDGAIRPGVPGKLGTPGLMMGVAGLGYGVLRAAAPESVPSVLLLATR